MDRQIMYNIIAGRQLDHCIYKYKMPPQTTLQFYNSYAQIVVRLF